MGFFEYLSSVWDAVLREAFMKAIQFIVDRVNRTKIESLIKEGKIEEAIHEIGMDPTDFREMTDAMGDAFKDAGYKAEKEIPKLGRAEFRFDIRNTTAENIIRTQSSTLVTDIIDDQRNAIRNHLTEGLINGVNPKQTALELVGRKDTATGQRTGGVIGLTEGQEAWQRNYARELASTDPDDLRNALTRNLRDKRFDASIRKAIATGKPIPAATREKMMMAYRNKTLKYRADVISRTESIKAFADAQIEAFRQAIDKGHVARQDIRRFWETSKDERVRPEHRLIPGMNEKGVGWDEPFNTPSGPVMHAPHDVMCRCRERIKVDYFAKLERGS